MKDVIARQREFDAKHGWDWRNLPIDKQIERLQYITVALAGELGEIANPLKKFLRDTERNGIDLNNFDKLKTELNEEIVDVFIYLMKMADVLGVDMEAAYFDKVSRNEQKHAKFAVGDKQNKTIRYDKLVRDKIPEIIAADGCMSKTRIATEEEYLTYLLEKLKEEALECEKKPTVTELADVLEVVHAIARHHNVGLDELETVRKERLQSRGGFTKRIILEETK
jgi:predicted house-cleaning noncanonical NTP pyrophosphatase (MazG superfamily)